MHFTIAIPNNSDGSRLTSNNSYLITTGRQNLFHAEIVFSFFSNLGGLTVNTNLTHLSRFEPKAKKSPRSRSAKAISRLADHTNHRRMNVLDVIGTADCLQSRGIPRSLIHMNKQPDHHRVGCAPVKKTSLVSATTYPSFIVFWGKKGLQAI